MNQSTANVHGINTTLHPSEKRILLGVCLILNALLSLWVCWHSTPNADAMTYFRAAIAYEAGGYHSATAIYPWPFYPIVLSCLHQLTGLSHLASAQLLSTVACGLLIVSFIQTVAILSQQQRTVIMSAACLIVTHPLLNSSRDMVIRDHAFWALLFCGLYCLLKFLDRSERQFLVYWHLSLLAACLFRVEAVFFWVGLTLAVLLLTTSHKKQALLTCASVLAMIIGLNAIVFFVLGAHLYTITRVEAVFQWLYATNWQAFAASFQTFSQALHTALKEKAVYPSAHSTLIAVSGLYVYFFTRLVVTIHPVFLTFAALGKQSVAHLWSKQHKLLFLVALAIAVLIPLLFFTHFTFITFRYLMPASLLVCVIACSGLAHSQRLWQRQAHYRLFSTRNVCILSLCYCLIDGTMSFGTDKYYLVMAGRWLAEHANKPTALYTNNAQIAFFSHHMQSRDWHPSTHTPQRVIEKLQQRTFHRSWLAIAVGHKQLELQQALAQYPGRRVKTFTNRKGDSVVIIAQQPTNTLISNEQSFQP